MSSPVVEGDIVALGAAAAQLSIEPAVEPAPTPAKEDWFDRRKDIGPAVFDEGDSYIKLGPTEAWNNGLKDQVRLYTFMTPKLVSIAQFPTHMGQWLAALHKASPMMEAAAPSFTLKTHHTASVGWQQAMEDKRLAPFMPFENMEDLPKVLYRLGRRMYKWGGHRIQTMLYLGPYAMMWSPDGNVMYKPSRDRNMTQTGWHAWFEPVNEFAYQALYTTEQHQEMFHAYAAIRPEVNLIPRQYENFMAESRLLHDLANLARDLLLAQREDCEEGEDEKYILRRNDFFKWREQYHRFMPQWMQFQDGPYAVAEDDSKMPNEANKAIKLAERNIAKYRPERIFIKRRRSLDREIY